MELAEGLLLAARARWITSSQAATQQHRDVERARSSADAALSALKTAEEEAAALSLAISRRADAERLEREALDRQRSQQTELRVGAARVDSELESIRRDADRLSTERGAVESRIAEHVRVLSAPKLEDEPVADDELALVERQLAELEAATGPGDAAREQRARAAELEQSERRRQGLERTLATARERVADLEQRLAAAENERDKAAKALQSATSAAEEFDLAAARARAEGERASTARSDAQQRLGETEAELVAARARLAAVESAMAGADDGLARAARARGASLLGEGLEVEPRFMSAVSAALGSAATAYLVTEDSVAPLSGRRGTLALAGDGRGAIRPASGAAVAAAANAASALIDMATSAGGGSLASDGVRRDPQGEVSRLLERVVWLPGLDAALDLRRHLPPGWRAVTLAGEVVADDGIITLAIGESALKHQAARDAARQLIAELEPRATADRAAYEDARTQATTAAEGLQKSVAQLDQHRRETRRHEETERLASRRAEQLLRETTWERGQLARLDEELAAALSMSQRLQSEIDALGATLAAHGGQQSAAEIQARRTTLREQRDRLRREREERSARVRSSEDARRRAEVGRGLDESRLAQIDTEISSLTSRLQGHQAQRAELASQLAAADAAVREAVESMAALLQGGSDERTRLVAAERSAAEAREKLRTAESSSRNAEMRSMEARLQLEQTREQLLVELATIGADGLLTLRLAAGREISQPDDESSAAETLEDLLEQVVGLWTAESSAGSQDAPSQSRLTTLRRRFNELGQGNPFAAEEYDELRERLETMEAQRADMETAIASTRELIASLSSLINDQFRSTFAALEDAFQRRFHELFGGGDAQLSLTTPEDISATGVEIHARPPGKKRQPLSMLSGGERALTAVSLLLAMLEVRPVPFCVLDEVDAALDEANVGRFARALRGLAEQTQFIVITHNRGTIESADALYGVTIDDDAVSRIVSLRLPERQIEDVVEAGVA